jgi:hypothetical protein
MKFLNEVTKGDEKLSNCSPWEAAGVVSRCRLGTKCS